MKAAAAVSLFLSFTTFLCAQGTVTFQNNGSIFGDVGTPPDRKVYLGSIGNGTGLVGTNYAAQLWYDVGTGMRPVPDAIRLFRVPTTTLPGTWNTAPTPTVVLPGVDIGQSAQLEVRVWDIQLFESFAAAVAGYGETGRSASFNYTVPLPGSPSSDYTLKGLRAFFSPPPPNVPEPATAALLLSSMMLLVAYQRMVSRRWVPSRRATPFNTHVS